MDRLYTELCGAARVPMVPRGTVEHDSGPMTPEQLEDWFSDVTNTSVSLPLYSKASRHLR